MIIDVSIGEIKIASNGAILATMVGSCICCCIYDKTKAAMAHIMLPYHHDIHDSHDERKGKYADIAISTILDHFNSTNLKAKIAGGARIFVHESSKDFFNIGYRNGEAVKEILSANGIKIEGEDLGGTSSRHILFDTRTFKMRIKSKMGELYL